MRRLRIFLLGGTSESRAAAQALDGLGIPVVASVTADDARRLYAGLRHVEARAGPLPREALRQALLETGASAVVDATHPFATSISRTAVQVSLELGIPYVRVERDELPDEASSAFVVVHASEDALWSSGVLRGRRVLLTIGTKGLAAWGARSGEATFYVRVMDRASSVARALAAGFPPERVIPMDPPVPEADERALWRRLEVEAVVAKASGPPGGEDVKRRVASSLGVPLHLLRRPAIGYPALVRTVPELLAWIGARWEIR